MVSIVNIALNKLLWFESLKVLINIILDW